MLFTAPGALSRARPSTVMIAFKGDSRDHQVSQILGCPSSWPAINVKASILGLISTIVRPDFAQQFREAVGCIVPKAERVIGLHV